MRFCMMVSEVLKVRLMRFHDNYDQILRVLSFTVVMKGGRGGSGKLIL